MEFFSKKNLTPPQENEVEITVFGSGYGESIVLHVPGVGWGVVDSCETKINNKRVIPPLQYLLEVFSPDLPPLAFVVLTHPHEDHYLGLEEIIREYSGGVERICIYDGVGTKEFKAYLASRYVATSDKPKFSKLYDTIVNAQRKRGVHLKNLVENTTIIEKRNEEISGKKIDIKIISLSPSSESLRRYSDSFLKLIPTKEGETLKLYDDSLQNLVSSALLIQVGDVQIILGSDVEKGSKGLTGWEGIITNKDRPDLWANYVKISHHGGESGYSQNAWDLHSKHCKPMAVMTPFVKGKKLPQNDDVVRLKKVADPVGLTHKQKFKTKLTDNYPRNVVKMLKMHSRSFEIPEHADQIGFIRTRLSTDGILTERLAQSPAIWL